MIAIRSVAHGQAVPDVGVPKVTALTPRSGPFGIYKGMSKDALSKVVRLASMSLGVYKLDQAPNPHPDFQTYQVVLTDKLGVCKVAADSRAIETSVFGEEVQSEFKTIEDAVTAKYGEPLTRQDYLKTGSIWDEPRDWMMGLLKKDRTLSTLWAAKPSKPIPDGIAAISLEAIAVSPNRVHLRLTYDFDTIKECVAEISGKRNSVF